MSVTDDGKEIVISSPPPQNASMEGFESEVEGPSKKKTDAERKKRRSIPHDRRSSRGIVLTNREDELCSTIPRDVSSDERLRMLLCQSIQVGLDAAFEKVGDINMRDQLKSSLKLSLEDVVNDCASRGLLKSAVSPSKARKLYPDCDNSEAKQSIMLAERCIKRLKTESDAWDILLDQYQKTSENVSTLKTSLNKWDGDKACRDLEHFENLTTQHQRILFHLKILHQSTSTLRNLLEQSERHLEASFRDLNFAATDGLDCDPKKLFLCLRSESSH